MSARKWRGVVVGCGFFARNHLHAWREAGAEIAALCDLDLAKARAMGDLFRIGAAYGDLGRLLQREKVDFVDIVTTVPSHRPLVELAAGRVGVVVCQKPFAETLADADAMVAACQAKGTLLIIHENFRWQRPFLEILRRLRAGAIGEPQTLRLSFRHDYDVYRQQPYLAQVERLALMDVGIHLFDLVRLLMGEVRSLHCRTRRLNPAIVGEDCFLASLRHETGAISAVECSFFARGSAGVFPQTFALLGGSEGSLELVEGYRLIERRGEGAAETGVEPPVPAWGERPWHCVQDSVLNFQRHVLDVLEGRASPQPSGAHNRQTLALVLAAYESAARDNTVEIELPRRMMGP